jgi:hypothetical protein
VAEQTGEVSDRYARQHGGLGYTVPDASGKRGQLPWQYTSAIDQMGVPIRSKRKTRFQSPTVEARVQCVHSAARLDGRFSRLRFPGSEADGAARGTAGKEHKSSPTRTARAARRAIALRRRRQPGIRRRLGFPSTTASMSLAAPAGSAHRSPASMWTADRPRASGSQGLRNGHRESMAGLLESEPRHDPPDRVLRCSNLMQSLRFASA